MAVAEAERGPDAIDRITLFRVLWRSFFFLAAMNYERMQNVGFAYCITPALQRLYKGEALKAAMQRHLEFFNSHPYMAAAVVGASIRLEEQVAAGELPPERVQSFKRCMMAPLAAIGDNFFWASLKPFGAAWAVAGVLSGILWAPVAFLLLYNLLHLAVRGYGLFAGYRLGEQVFERIHKLDLVRLAERSHYAAGLFLGVTAALLAHLAVQSPAALGSNLEPILLVVLTLIFFLCLRRKMTVTTLLYVFAGGTVIVMGALNALFPLL